MSCTLKSALVRTQTNANATPPPCRDHLKFGATCLGHAAAVLHVWLTTTRHHIACFGVWVWFMVSDIDRRGCKMVHFCISLQERPNGALHGVNEYFRDEYPPPRSCGPCASHVYVSANSVLLRNALATTSCSRDHVICAIFIHKYSGRAGVRRW